MDSLTLPSVADLTQLETDSLWNGLPAEDPILDSAVCCGCHAA